MCERAIALVVVVCGLLIVPGARIGAAGEAAQHAAGLQGEQAECKHVLDLCSESRRRDAAFKSAKRDVERDSTVENIDRYRDTFMQSHVAFSNVTEAAKVITQKHGKSPSCLSECSDVIELRRNADLP